MLPFLEEARWHASYLDENRELASAIALLINEVMNARRKIRKDWTAEYVMSQANEPDR